MICSACFLFLHQYESVGQLHCKPQIEISITFMQGRFPRIYSNCCVPVYLDASSRGSNFFYSRTSLSHINTSFTSRMNPPLVAICIHHSRSILSLLKLSYCVHEAANKLMKPRSPRSYLFVSTTLHVSLISQSGIMVVFTLF